MKLLVKSGYVGIRTLSQQILPGLYEVGSEHLYGCEAELVELGRAEYVSDDYTEAVEVLLAPVVSSDVDVLGGFDPQELTPELVAQAQGFSGPYAGNSEPQAIESVEETPEAEPDEPVAPRKRGKGSK